ncbi:MAG: hypothetical protein RBR62_03865 [Bacteroidales bacterium]|jgi:primosomal protein N'|nr:hypothetical protein [Bacteroidales bacterium]
MKETYAHILFPLALDSEYTYRIPPELAPAAIPGKQVTAPVGNRIQTGIITHIFDAPHTLDAPHTRDTPHSHDSAPTPDTPHSPDIKDILSVEEKLPVVPEKTLRFWHWIASYYLCPTGLVAKMASSSWKFKRRAPAPEEPSLEAAPQETTQEAESPLPGAELPFYLQLGNRTEIYKKEILAAIRAGKQCLILCPDMVSCETVYNALLPELEDQLFCFHSKRAAKELGRARRELYAGYSCAVVGMHLALLLPFTHPELIIVEREEHPGHKKTDALPLLHGRDAALMLGHIFESRVILGSASPSLETLHNLNLGKYKMYPDIPAPELSFQEVVVINTSLSYPAISVTEPLDFRTREKIDQCKAEGREVLLIQGDSSLWEEFSEEENTTWCRPFQTHHHLKPNTGLICFLGMDVFLSAKNFRATEQAFHLMADILCWATAQTTPATICVQTANVQHPFFEYLQTGNMQSTFSSLLQERQTFHYPPYTRLIHITVRHHNKTVAKEKVNLLHSHLLKANTGIRIEGPFVPTVWRSLHFTYRLQCTLPKTSKAQDIKNTLATIIKNTPLAPAKYRVDVDPA